MPLQLASDNDPNAPQNPLRIARLALGLTQQELASRAQLSPLTVLLSEQGCYIEPPGSLIDTLCDLGKRSEWAAEALLALTPSNYKAWRRRKRAYISQTISQGISFDDFYRVHCKESVSALSKLCMVPLAAAQEFVRGRSNQIVIQALSEVGVQI